MSKNLLPNKDAILAHLNFLFSGQTDGLIEIAYTPATTSAVNSASFFNVTELDQAAAFAADKNAIEGVNVYVGAALRNPNTAPFGRSNRDDYYKSTAIWCDLDDADAAKQAKEKYKELVPSFVVVTGRHPDLRAQVWWKLTEPQEAPAVLKQSLSNVCAALNGDKSVVDPIRIMRLGGTVAWPKKEGRIPEMTEITTPKNATTSVTLEAFTSYFPPVAPVDKPVTVGGVDLYNAPKSNLKLTGWSIDNVREHLSYINPDCGYDEWIAVGMGLQAEGYDFHLWNDWSARGLKYDANSIRQHWRSFKGTGVGYGTIVHMAKRGGWKPATTQFGVNSFKNNTVYPAQVIEDEFDPETGEIIEPDQKKNGLYYINAPDITFSTSVTDFVKNTLTDGGLSVVYGESNCGKTFFMTDMAFHIVLGKEWHGKRVKQGNVLYVSMEGSYGLKNRIAAYKKQYNTDLSGFLMMPCSVDFINPEGNISEFVSVLADAKAKLGNIRLVVVDTLARAIGGGDENSGQDMGLLVKHADMIREYTGAHVCFIHHSGKDKARGARGHSSLRAAVDTEIEISRTESADFSNIKIAKQRDIEIAEDTQFKLKRVVLGMNDDNEEITSCIVEPYSAKDDLDNVIENKFKNNKIRLAYDALIDCIDKYGAVKQSKDLPSVRVVSEEQFKQSLTTRGLLSDNPHSARTQASRYRIDLIENKLAVARDGYIWSTRIT
jgi:hypothetical protein